MVYAWKTTSVLLCCTSPTMLMYAVCRLLTMMFQNLLYEGTGLTEINPVNLRQLKILQYWWTGRYYNLRLSGCTEIAWTWSSSYSEKRSEQQWPATRLMYIVCHSHFWSATSGKANLFQVCENRVCALSCFICPHLFCVSRGGFRQQQIRRNVSATLIVHILGEQLETFFAQFKKSGAQHGWLHGMQDRVIQAFEWSFAPFARLWWATVTDWRLLAKTLDDLVGPASEKFLIWNVVTSAPAQT